MLSEDLPLRLSSKNTICLRTIQVDAPTSHAARPTFTCLRHQWPGDSIFNFHSSVGTFALSEIMYLSPTASGRAHPPLCRLLLCSFPQFRLFLGCSGCNMRTSLRESSPERAPYSLSFPRPLSPQFPSLPHPQTDRGRFFLLAPPPYLARIGGDKTGSSGSAVVKWRGAKWEKKVQ